MALSALWRAQGALLIVLLLCGFIALPGGAHQPQRAISPLSSNEPLRMLTVRGGEEPEKSSGGPARAEETEEQEEEDEKEEGDDEEEDGAEAGEDGDSTSPSGTTASSTSEDLPQEEEADEPDSDDAEATGEGGSLSADAADGGLEDGVVEEGLRESDEEGGDVAQEALKQEGSQAEEAVEEVAEEEEGSAAAAEGQDESGQQATEEGGVEEGQQGKKRGAGAGKKKKRRKKKKTAKEAAQKKQEGPRPPSRAELALMQNASGRMLLTFLMIQKELLRSYLPQLYYPLVVLCRLLEERAGLFSRLGLAPDPHDSLSRRRRTRAEFAQGGRRRSELEEEEDEEEDELSEEKLLPSPVDRYRRVSAGFLARHGLVGEEGEEVVGQVPGRGRRRGEDDDDEAGGPSFGVTWNLGSVAGQGRGAVVGSSRARPMTDLKEGLEGDVVVRRPSRVATRERRKGSRTMPSLSLPTSLPSWIPSADKLLEDSTKTIGDSLTSLTSTLSKTLTIKKKKKAKAPRRKLFQDDEEEEETEDNWHLKLPPRRTLTSQGPVVLKAGGRGAQEQPWREKDGGDAVGEGRKGRGKASLSLIERAGQEDEDEEEDATDWLSMRKKQAGAGGAARRQTDYHALARRRRGKSLFGDDDDEDEEAGGAESSKEQRGGGEGASSSSSSSSRGESRRFVRRVEDISGSGSRLFAGRGLSASEKVEEVRRRTSLELGRTQRPPSSSSSASRSKAGGDSERGSSSRPSLQLPSERSRSSAREEIDDIRRRTSAAFSSSSSRRGPARERGRAGEEQE